MIWIKIKIKIKIKITALKQNRELKNVTGEIVAYFKKPVRLGDLKPANLIEFESKLNAIEGPLNPGEFNYHDFLTRKNIYYQCFIDSGAFKFIGKNDNFSFLNFGLEIKQKIIRAFKNSDLNSNAANLCIALLTGYDDEIKFRNHQCICTFRYASCIVGFRFAYRNFIRCISFYFGKYCPPQKI